MNDIQKSAKCMVKLKGESNCRERKVREKKAGGREITPDMKTKLRKF